MLNICATHVACVFIHFTCVHMHNRCVCINFPDNVNPVCFFEQVNIFQIKRVFNQSKLAYPRDNRLIPYY